MSPLGILYLVIIVLYAGALFAPEPWRARAGYIQFVLFLILGLKVFGLPTS